MALVVCAAMTAATGCTVIHDTPNAQQPTAEQPAEGTTAATPAPASNHKFIPGRLRKLRQSGDAPADQTQTAASVGTLDIQVIDGSCQIAIDGQDFGMTNKVNTQLAVGEHQVDCKPQDGNAQTNSATVRPNDTTHVIISLQAGQSAQGAESQVPESVKSQLKQ